MKNEDKVKALVKIFPLLDASNVITNTATGYIGPITEISFNGVEFWVLTEEEANREATASFLDTVDGDIIEHDPVLNMTAELSWILDYNAIREVYMNATDNADDKVDSNEDNENYEDGPDDDSLHDWARDNYSNAELWEMGMIDKEKFCEHLWDVYGYGQELDIEQHNESVEIDGTVLYVFLRNGDWRALDQ